MFWSRTDKVQIQSIQDSLQIIIYNQIFKPVKQVGIQMRNSPSSKKTQYNKLIQSRTMITSSSINPLSKNITTKLDIIKQEILRQYNQKFPSEKKRTTSVKKSNSASKGKLKQQKLSIDPLSRKLNFNRQNQSHGINTTVANKINLNSESNFQNKAFRQKINQMQDRLFEQKQKVIQHYQKNSLLKQNIIQFLQQPNSQTAAQLKNHFGSERQYKIIDNFISMREDIDYAESTFGQLLSIVQVDSIENLLKQLKNRQNGYKNLSECSYKIIELQTAYNKLQGESQDKLKQIINEQNKKQKQLKTQLQNQTLKYQQSIERIKKQEQDSFKRALHHLLQSISSNQQNTFSQGASLLIDEVCSSRAMYITFDKNSNKKKLQQDAQIRENKALQELFQNKNVQQYIYQIKQVFSQIQSNIFDIEREAQQNAEKLKTSKNDMDRLERLIQSVTRETQEQKNKLIQSYQTRLQQQHAIFERVEEKLKEAIFQKQQQFQKLSAELRNHYAKIQQATQQQQKYQKQINEMNEKIMKKQTIIIQIIKIICETTGEDINIFGFDFSEGQLYTELKSNLSQIAVNKIEVILKKHLLILKQNLQSAENLILWHEKQLQIKQSLLKQFDFNLKKLVEQSESFYEKQKQLCFERDQYKYLLTNLRETVKEMKKQYEMKIVKTAEQKDDEYLNSNKDILLQNQRLNAQIQGLKQQIGQLNKQVKSQMASHEFYRKKSEQFQQSILELKKRLIATEDEAKNYKKCLSDIEVSFKEVQSMSQIRSQKMIGLQSENKTISNQIRELKAKIQQLSSSIQLKDDSFNKLQYTYEQNFKKCQKLTKIKQDIELENSNLRIKNIEVMEQCRNKIQEFKQFEYENVSLNKQNKKLMQQVNYLTKKLINYVGDEQKLNRTRKLVKNQFNKLKQCYIFMKNAIQDKLQLQKNQIKLQVQQITQQFVNDFIGFGYHKQINNSYDNFSKYDKLNVNDKNCNKIKIQLLLNSIRNENSEIKSMVSQFYKYVSNLIKSYRQKSIQFLKRESPFNKEHEQQCIDDQHIELKSQYESLDLQDQKQQNAYFMSPQFVRIHNQTYSQENSDAKQQKTKYKQKWKDGKEKGGQVNINGNNNNGSVNNKGANDQIRASNKTNSVQVERVKNILNSLKDGENEDPRVPYFDAIRGQFKQLKKKLHHKNLNLDISAVSFKPQTVSSPSSVSFSKQFVFDKRCNTQPNQDLGGSMAPRQTNRSQNKNDRSILSLKKQNQAYKQQIQKLQQILKTGEDRQELLKIQLSQLEKKIVQLQNESSKQTKDKLFNKFITQIFNQNWKDAKVSCRTLLKLIGLARETINQKLEDFDNFVNRNAKKK